MTWLKKTVVWAHRYLGILLSAMFLMWFLTGIGMIYSRGMPRLTPEVRLARLSPVDLDKVKLTPAEAAAVAEIDGAAGRTTMVTVLDRPAYRFSDFGTQTVFADTGELMLEVDAAQGKTIAARFMELPEDQIQDAGLVREPDQWTLNQVRQLPLYKYAVSDSAGTELYVSPGLGEIVQLTTRKSRMLAWVSTIPHFFYF